MNPTLPPSMSRATLLMTVGFAFMVSVDAAWTLATATVPLLEGLDRLAGAIADWGS